MNIKEAKLIIEVLEELGPIQNENFGSIDRLLVAGADHDIIYLDISLEEVPEDSLLGKKLDEACTFPSHEFNCWCMYV